MRDDCTGIEGMEGGEAETLIAALADHIVKPAFVYRHQWRGGGLLMWDNCTAPHRAVPGYDLPQRRLMHPTTMCGTTPPMGQGIIELFYVCMRAPSPPPTTLPLNLDL